MSNDRHEADHHAYANSTFGPPPLADPDAPFRVENSHLMKMELGKSSSSCKLSFVTRLNRRAVLQEFWCASYEEAAVYQNIAAHSDVINFKEQLTRVDFVGGNGKPTYTKVDAHLLLKDMNEVLFSVKYDTKARRKSYIEEIANIAGQCSRQVADRFNLGSRYAFHPVYRKCAAEIHKARRGWDPESDRIVLEAANDLGGAFSFGALIDRSMLGAKGYRAAVRLIGDGEITKNILDPFCPETRCRSAA